MRSSALRTRTTNSRGVCASLTRMALCSRGRWVSGLILAFGLMTVSLIELLPAIDARRDLEVPTGRFIPGTRSFNVTMARRHGGRGEAEARGQRDHDLVEQDQQG